LFAASVLPSFQDIVHATRIHPVIGSNVVLELPFPMPQPYIYGIFEGQLVWWFFTLGHRPLLRMRALDGLTESGSRVSSQCKSPDDRKPSKAVAVVDRRPGFQPRLFRIENQRLTDSTCDFMQYSGRGQ
jgi:hypothetical protein